MSELKSTLTFEQFLSDLKITAYDSGAAEHHGLYEDLKEEVKAEIKAEFDAVDSFSLISQDTLNQQLKDYDTGYLGDEIKVNDLVWFDGEVECCEETVRGWFRETFESVHDELSYSTWKECAQFVKEKFVLHEFERLSKTLTQA